MEGYNSISVTGNSYVDTIRNAQHHESLQQQCQNSNVNNTSTTNMFRDTMIDLNNTAVTILGLYNDYKVSIEIMKCAFELLKSCTTTSTNELYRQRAITLASERMKQLQIQNYHNNNGSNTPAVAPTFPSSTNNIGVIVLKTNDCPNNAYHLLSSIRTSKVALYITKPTHTLMNNDYTDDINSTNIHVVQSILVYNYGIAHRCCMVPILPKTPVQSDNNVVERTIEQKNSIISTFCLQIFQYAEQLLLPVVKECNQQNELMDQTTSIDDILLYRFLLTRNLMMTSCKLGMSLCELYKQTLDPIENKIIFINDSIYNTPSTTTTSNHTNNNNNIVQHRSTSNNSCTNNNDNVKNKCKNPNSASAA